MLLFLVLAEEPMIQAWGCYPSSYSIGQLDDGLCPAFLHRFNPETSLSPVCTRVQGSFCGGENLAWSATFSHGKTIARSLVSVSFTLYMWSVPTKIEYYALMHARGLTLAKQ
jgi:hypothetical protein